MSIKREDLDARRIDLADVTTGKRLLHFWINLQARYDLDAAERKLRRHIERKVRPRAA